MKRLRDLFDRHGYRLCERLWGLVNKHERCLDVDMHGLAVRLYVLIEATWQIEDEL